MIIISKIKQKIDNYKIYKDENSFTDFLRKRGIVIGKNFHISANGPLKNIIIDNTRPSLVTIGDNVTINKNFTLVTHDFVCGVFINKYKDFIPSSGAVSIGNNVRFGANCIVLKGVTIGDNCFIAAGSVVSNDIPANSLASGNPCKVVCSMDSFYRFRQEACKAEAYLYAQSIVKRFNRNPIPTDFWEEFPLFVDKTNIEKYPEIPIRRQLQSAYNIWIENHVAPFKSFEDFLNTALNYRAPIQDNNRDNNNCVSPELIKQIREIVSRCTGTELSDTDDKINMDNIEGWSSLPNMMILSEIEKTFNISISSEDMFNMVSVYTIAQIVAKHTSVSEECIKKYSNISVLYPHSPLLSGICKNIEATPNKFAIICNGVNVSYSSFYKHVCKVASLLVEMGICHGDNIVLSAQKDIEFIYLYFACHIIGVTTVIVDSESNAERLAYIEKQTHPKHCFGYRSQTYPSSSYRDLDIENAKLLQTSPEADKLKASDIAEIIFTTGTTSAPKGVCLSYNNIYCSASNINEFIKNDAKDIELIGLPICHSFGLGRIRCNLLKGATIVIIGSFANVQKIFKVIEEEHVTGFGVVPAAWAYLKKASGDRLSKYANNIHYIEIGSASMPLEAKKDLLQMFPNTRICMHYGLTEASRSAFLEFHDKDHLRSIGNPVATEVSIKCFDHYGKEMPVGEVGELCVKGNMVFDHYLDDRDNKNAFYGEYFRTGDNGYIGEDGYIYLLGREKELINVGGKKVSPMEVEDAVCSIGVGDCVCAPMKDPKGVMGELVKCYVLKNSTELTFEQISEAIVPKLENYKRPVVYEWIDKIPTTSSGKKIRINLK